MKVRERKRAGRLYGCGWKFQKVREMAGISQEEAANVIGKKQGTIANYECDDIGIAVDDADKLLKYYKTKHHTVELKQQQNSLSQEQREKLYNGNTRLAFFFVNRYYNPADTWNDKKDMEQIALMALWAAVCFCREDMDEKQFGSYAAKHIKGELVDYLYAERQSQKGVNVSATTLARAYNVRSMIDEGLTPEKIAVDLGYSVDRINRLLDIVNTQDADSLNTVNADGDEYEGANMPYAEDAYAVYDEERSKAVAQMLETIPDNEREVIYRVHGFGEYEPTTLQALAEETTESYGTLYKRYKLGMAKLRHPRNSNQLAEYI